MTFRIQDEWNGYRGAWELGRYRYERPFLSRMKLCVFEHTRVHTPNHINRQTDVLMTIADYRSCMVLYA